MLYKRATTAWRRVSSADPFVLYQGDCLDLIASMPSDAVALTVTSPPYCMGKEYEAGSNREDFATAHRKLLPEIVRITKPGGSICWQVGYHVQNGALVPLDFLVYEIMREFAGIHLRNRIVWTFGHGLHCSKRFSGRHEVVLWFTKGDDYRFDLDAIRIPQKYPGKKSSRGPKRGVFSGNALGKNPSDVWDIPNVKANHVEKTSHPCQFPVALALRFAKALTKPGDVVFDPFCGVASTGVAAILAERRFLGAELDQNYGNLGAARCRAALNGVPQYRALDREIHVPKSTDAVVKRPEHFKVPNNSHEDGLENTI